jgi:hypothetical protein
VERPPPPEPWLEGVSPDSGLPRPSRRETEAPQSLPLERRLDVGAGLAFLGKLAEGDDRPGDDITYDPTLGLEVHLRIPILDQVEISPYFLVAAHGIDVPAGALEGVAGGGSVEPGSVTSLGFGARVARTFQVDPVRVWASAGVGYGRLEFGRMIVREPGRAPFEIRDRGASFVEFPFGAGAALTVVPRWLSVDLEAAAAPVLNKSGPANTEVRTIDGSGQLRDVGGMPPVTASLVVALGLSLVL